MKVIKHHVKVLRMPPKTTFNALAVTSECHQVPGLPQKIAFHDVAKLQSIQK